MKDRQAPQTNAQVRVPVLSPVLHFVTMPAIVYLRSGFGYAFLRPKAIFISFSWAFVLYTVYAWLEPGAWRRSAALCLFGLGAVLLYGAHLTFAFVSELRGTATHDNDSGVPHLVRILNSAGIQLPEQLRSLWAIWGEPTLVLLVALAARWPLGASSLSTWLLLVAPCLWFKEALNHWLQIRQRKRQRDAMEDAQDGLDGSHSQTDLPAPAASRKDKMRRKRAA